MRSLAREGEAVARWDVARAARPGRCAGAGLAGFRDLGTGPVAVGLVPRPAVTVVVEFGDGPFSVVDGSGRRHRGSLAAGLVPPGGARLRGEGVTCVEVHLPPPTAFRVLGIRPAELAGGVVPLDALWGRDLARLREQLWAAPSWRERFALTDAVPSDRSGTGPSADPEVARAWHRIVAARGRIRIGELAAEVGWSRGRLWSGFRSQIGLTPKRAAMLVRFRYAAHRLVAGASAAAVAAECGYVDQSHLHHETVAFTGLTPAALAGDPGVTVDDTGWTDPRPGGR